MEKENKVKVLYILYSNPNATQKRFRKELLVSHVPNPGWKIRVAGGNFKVAAPIQELDIDSHEERYIVEAYLDHWDNSSNVLFGGELFHTK